MNTNQSHIQCGEINQYTFKTLYTTRNFYLNLCIPGKCRLLKCSHICKTTLKIGLFYLRYKDYTEHLNNLVRTLLSDQLSLDKVRLTSESVDRLKNETVYIYEHLVRISTMARDETLVQVYILSSETLLINFPLCHFKFNYNCGVKCTD